MNSNLGPVEIEIDDLNKFASIALLVDRDDFLEDLNKFRRLLHLDHIPYQLPIYPIQESHWITEEYRNNRLTISEARKSLEEVCVKRNYINLNQLDKVLGGGVVATEAILKRYNKGRSYFPAVFAALLTNRITTYDFPSTYMLEFKAEEIKDEFGNVDVDEDCVAIIVSRDSKEKEVIGIFDHIQKYYYKSVKVREDDNFLNLYDQVNNQGESIKTLSEIKTHREWYWWNKNENIGAKKIRDRLGGDNACISQKGIEQALTRYKKLLNS